MLNFIFLCVPQASQLLLHPSAPTNGDISLYFLTLFLKLSFGSLLHGLSFRIAYIHLFICLFVQLEEGQNLIKVYCFHQL